MLYQEKSGNPETHLLLLPLLTYVSLDDVEKLPKTAAYVHLCLANSGSVFRNQYYLVIWVWPAVLDCQTTFNISYVFYNFNFFRYHKTFHLYLINNNYQILLLFDK
jgi:hypothetical protein